MDGLVAVGLTVFMVGVALIFIGFLLEFLKCLKKTGRVKTAGAVLVGPFPIVFGDKDLVKYSVVLLILMTVLTLVLIIVSGVLI
jgi:uncharacterized protein (TIGR00304 family)